MKKSKHIVWITVLLAVVSALAGCRSIRVKNPLSNSGGAVNVPTVNTTANTAFKPVVFVTSGSHSYYSDDMFDFRNVDSKTEKMVKKQFEKADKTLYEDIYITGFNTGLNSPNSVADLRLFGCLLLDGAIYEEFRVVADDDGSGIYWRDVDNTVPIPQVDKTGLADPADFFDRVYKMATSHEKDILEPGSKKPITGTYVLMVNPAGELFYRFEICEYSYVDVNAKTGTIMHEYYWNGCYVD